jgi:methylthioribose-1-phosphate isomerase
VSTACRTPLIADNAAGLLLARGRIDAVIVGADRVAANGDVANKIGTYLKALAARAAGVPFYVAAPRSTIDFACTNGADIPIEERAG